MNAAITTSPSQPVTQESRIKPWRIWVLLVLLPLMVIARFVPEWIPEPPANIWMVSAFGPLLLSLGILLWFALASRARWWERLLGSVGLFTILALVMAFSDASFAGPPFMVLTIPLTVAGFGLGALAFGSTLSRNRVWHALAMAAAIGGVCALLKTEGVWGNFKFDLSWRWNETAEERFLAQRSEAEPTEPAAIDESAAETFLRPQWPHLRGPQFDGVVRDLQISDDWKAAPPKELWRIAVGPAWSSFAVASPFLVTQEQRGESEFVVCYDADTGKEVWAHAEPGRFFESLGGLGPRSTPTIHNGFVYALGAEGKLVKLDPKSGKDIWKVDLCEIAGLKPPMWGFSSSPLVNNDKVIVYAGNERVDQANIYAFKTDNGEVAWKAPAGNKSYASVQPLEVLGRTYLALLSDLGLHLYEPDSGKVVLDYAWLHSGYRALQPQVVDGDKVVIPTGLGSGTRLIQAVDNEGTLQVKDVWTSLDMKPDYNDLLVHQGHLYGFDNNIFACISLKDGKRKWKGGRYEKGQAILLAGSDLIIVVSEKGELVLLQAKPDKLHELAKLPAVHGKTWNHPVVVGNRLYVRNAEEAVCYELANAQSPEATPDQAGAAEATSETAAK